MKPSIPESRARCFPLPDLLSWWDHTRRPLPWRKDRSPWRTWVSEVMLQQTRVAAVIPYFQSFMDLFPDPARLAAADSNLLMKTWEGLGYYRRVVHLQRAAARVVTEHAGEIPKDPRAFAALPGAGPYITAAVMSIAFGHALPAVDGNVLRVIARYRGSFNDIGEPRERRRVERMLHRVIPADRPGDFNEALMELGAMVCLPRRANCAACPLASACRSHSLGLTTVLPIRSRRASIPEREVAVALVCNGDRILVRRRPPGHLGGLWEFPGGRLRSGETPQAAIQRKCHEELNMSVRVGEVITAVRHAYTHFRIHMQVFRAVCSSRPPVETDNLRWILPAQLEDLPLPGANRKSLPAILALAWGRTTTV